MSAGRAYKYSGGPSTAPHSFGLIEDLHTRQQRLGISEVAIGASKPGHHSLLSGMIDAPGYIPSKPKWDYWSNAAFVKGCAEPLLSINLVEMMNGSLQQ